MKNILTIIVFLFVILSISFADEIHLKDSSIIKCEIIQVSARNIEYKTVEKPFLSVPRESVIKIVFKDGKTFQIAGITYDKIIFTNSRIIEVKIVIVDTENIIYTLPDSDEKQSVKRPDVDKIIYANVQEALFDSKIKKANIQNEAPAQEEPPPYIQKKGFKDSTFSIGILGAWGFIHGDLNNKENNATTRYKGGAETYPIYPEGKDKKTLDNEDFYYGLEIGLYYPAVPVKNESGLGLRGIKFGISSNYTFHYIQETLYDRSLRDNTHIEKLMEYNEFRLGPEMNLILSPISNKVNLVFRFYGEAGYIHNGTLTALPGLRDAGLVMDKREYTVDFTGYSATGGFGIRFVSNLAFSVITGFDVQYTYSKIKFERNLEVYNNANKASFDEIAIVMSAGIHF
jgi:hypothetical protein